MLACSTTTRLRWLTAPIAAALVSGCPAAPNATSCPPTSALYSGVVTGAVILRDSAGTAWTDGSPAELVFGSQGGFMITPAVEIDGALADGPTPCLRVTLEHRDPGGTTIFEEFRFRETNERFVRTIAGDLRTEPIFDQLRWAPLPSGTPVEITVTVRGESFAAQSVVTVMLVPEA